MRLDRLAEILDAFPRKTIGVIGDFFLDQYWTVDSSLAEVSLETGRTAHQIVEVRVSPGAAGTVTSNLSALGVGRIEAVGLLGEDGNGFELLRALERMGVSTQGLVRTDERFTPVYTKPMLRRGEPPDEEQERFDLKNRTPVPETLEDIILSGLDRMVESIDVLLVLDQVQEEDRGVITLRVRARLAELGDRRPEPIILVDSRAHIGCFRNVMIKPNESEASAAAGPSSGPEDLARELYAQCARPLFITRGARGMFVFDGVRCGTIPALDVPGPLDTVGAGDSASAALASALAAGCDPFEAAQVAVLAASVTIRKIGTTGTASPDEILATARRYRLQVEAWPVSSS
jgi:rfaE bifunctional protein kinase chain/domain